MQISSQIVAFVYNHPNNGLIKFNFMQLWAAHYWCHCKQLEHLSSKYCGVPISYKQTTKLNINSRSKAKSKPFFFFPSTTIKVKTRKHPSWEWFFEWEIMNGGGLRYFSFVVISKSFWDKKFLRYKIVLEIFFYFRVQNEFPYVRVQCDWERGRWVVNNYVIKSMMMNQCEISFKNS